MGKLVVIKMGEGDWDKGFPVILQIGEERKQPSVEITGRLPGVPEIPQYYEEWQSLYRHLPVVARLVAPAIQVTNVAIPKDCHQKVQVLRNNLNHWLDSETFRPLKEQLLENLDRSESIRVIIQTRDWYMQRLPWHLLDFFDHFPKAEVAISAPVYEKVPEPVAKKKVRILAILGNSEGIDVQADRKFLEKLPGAETVFLVEPPRRDISDQLWEQQWDIFFFAGHSCSRGQTGLIDINKEESLSLNELKHGLKKAIEKGLQLAIFNSCDGLGLAQELANLHIPQVIVMREPVPDKVAQEFLKYFLSAFSQGQSLYLAVRTARERLSDEGLEAEIPGVTWLPVIFQNPAAVPMTWLGKQKSNNRQVGWLVGVVMFVAALLGIPTLRGYFSNLALYKDKDRGIKIEYPKGWEAIALANPRGDIAKFVSPAEGDLDVFQEKIMITIEPLDPPGTSLDMYTQETIKQISQELTTDTLPHKGNPTQLANLEAREVIYRQNRQRDEGKNLKKLQVWTVYNNKVYILTYEAEEGQYGKFEETARQTIKSFKIE
jgi:hypothetical protein